MKTQKKSVKSADQSEVIDRYYENQHKKREAVFEDDPGRIWFGMIPRLVPKVGEPEVKIAIKLTLSLGEWGELKEVSRARLASKCLEAHLRISIDRPAP